MLHLRDKFIKCMDVSKCLMLATKQNEMKCMRHKSYMVFEKCPLKKQNKMPLPLIKATNHLNV